MKVVKVIVGIFCVAFLLSVCGGLAEDSDSGGNDYESDVDTGFGSNDASNDVRIGPCDNTWGIVECSVTIVNHSDEPSDYYIDVDLERNGQNVGDGFATADHVDPGQTAKTEVIGTAEGDGPVTATATTIQRTAS